MMSRTLFARRTCPPLPGPSPTSRIHLVEAENRIMSIADAHERLYESPDLASVDAAAYFEDIVTAVGHSSIEFFPGAAIGFSSEPLHLPLEVALPCGLILNGLLSNCLMHAFAGRDPEAAAAAPAAVAVTASRLKEPAGGGRVCVRDNGVGVDLPAAELGSRSVDIVLVRSLVAQLRGSVERRRRRGAEAVLSLPLALSEKPSSSS